MWISARPSSSMQRSSWLDRSSSKILEWKFIIIFWENRLEQIMTSEKDWRMLEILLNLHQVMLKRIQVYSCSIEMPRRPRAFKARVWHLLWEPCLARICIRVWLRLSHLLRCKNRCLIKNDRDETQEAWEISTSSIQLKSMWATSNNGRSHRSKTTTAPD